MHTTARPISQLSLPSKAPSQLATPSPHLMRLKQSYYRTT